MVQYGKYDVQAIMSQVGIRVAASMLETFLDTLLSTQVTNGNGAMPAFGDKLGPDDIEV